MESGDLIGMEDEIRLLNKIIEAAIQHGGNDGDPYFSDPETLADAMQEWLELMNYDGQYVIDDDNGEFLQFIPAETGAGEDEDEEKADE